jgi:hypothetical protein
MGGAALQRWLQDRPLFADDTQAAEVLYAHLAGYAAVGRCFSMPRRTTAAIEFVHQHRMIEVFGCARMYLGPSPASRTSVSSVSQPSSWADERARPRRAFTEARV